MVAGVDLLRDFFVPGRSLAVGDRGMVATSHPDATLAGLDILRQGGNAVDAAIAAVAMQCVVEPHMTGIGGDCFALLAKDGHPPLGINGSGWSPADFGVERLRGLGVSSITDHMPHAATIPGAVSAWCRLSRDHGHLPLARVLEPAVQAARDGFRITPRVAADWAAQADRLRHNAAAAAAFLAGGSTPQAGDRRDHPALGRTLAAIGEHGEAAFYRGEAAQSMVRCLRALGGLHAVEDFERYEAMWIEPIQAGYRGRTIHECPPNGQGVIALLILRILERFDLSDPALAEADRIHILAEATKIAYAVRNGRIADPEVSATSEDVLSDAFVARAAASIDLAHARAPDWVDAIEHKDTVYVSVVDRDLTAVSLINSLFASFGTGIYDPGTGVMFQNRGISFRLDEDHPNSAAPRKRPMHTIIPGLMSENGRCTMSFGVMGGHYQACGHASLISQIVDRGRNPQAASDAPRSFAVDGRLDLEPAFGSQVSDELARRGHAVARATGPIGGCQAIMIDRERGALYGASDHRKDGVALGY